MDNERLAELRNAVMNLSGASSDAQWSKVKELFDKLYAARRGRLEVDRGGLPAESCSMPQPVKNRLEVLRETRAALIERAQAEDELFDEI